MFGFGKRKVTQAEFEVELTRLLSAYQDWQGGDNREATPTLVTQLSEFKRIRPEGKVDEQLSRLLRDVMENQVKAVSYLGPEMEEDAAGGFSRKGLMYAEKVTLAGQVLLWHMERLEESDPVRKILVDSGFYVP